MKTEVLLRSIGKINDELIADAESEANTKRKPGWAKLGIMAACLALVLCTGIAANAIRSNATAGTFTMDVNPSVEYTIAKSGIVKNVRCLNSDAENALSDVALGKQSVETALTRTVAAYEACGYMENGEATVLISFDSRLDANAELKASLSAKIRKALEQTDAVGTLVFHSELTENAEVAKIAEEFHVSLGRADWILTAANKTGLPTDEVSRMSLDELLKFQEVSGISSVSVSKFISLEEAKKIALKDAKLDELAQKIVFTREELSRNQGNPCYLLEFYTGTNQYFYQIDAKSGSIIYAGKFITLSEAKKIALDDAGCKDKVSFTEETLVSGGIKTPYYRLVFADAKTQWTYRIDAVLGNVLEKQQKEIVTTDFISLEEAKEIALKDAGLNESTQKIVFTREELNRNSGKPCYILEFYTAKKQYSYKVDAKDGSIMEAYHFILLADAKKIALDDAGVSEKVTFTEETLVAGGSLVMEQAAKKGVRIYPVDSEHSAIFQCLQGNRREQLHKIILTASGGPFFGKTRQELEHVTVADALNHPNWSMGNKITIDSATLMNKGLEFIEAKWLFDLTPEQIEIVVHRQSVVHSAVEYQDCSVIAQMGVPDMKIPIQYALLYPERLPCPTKHLSLTDYGTLTFEKPDMETFSCLKTAIAAITTGGTAPCIVNGANEVAVAAFLSGKIRFLDIGALAQKAMEMIPATKIETYEDVMRADTKAREFVRNTIA